MTASTSARTRSKRSQCVFESLWAFDQAYLAEQPEPAWLIGLDEVGRGSWVGPVVAAAVAFHPQVPAATLANALGPLNDSKQLRRAAREQLAEAIPQVAWVGYGEASVPELETLNVHHASLLALRRAVQALQSQVDAPLPVCLLVDGRFPLPDWPREAQRAVVKGDGHSAAIAAASVVAKVRRDRMLAELGCIHPGYGWERNAGYGTPAHQQAIRDLGLTVHHRPRFVQHYYDMAV